MRIDYNYYRHLFEEDSKSVSGLRKCPKLTMAHIRPNGFQKMVVSFATQVIQLYKISDFDLFQQNSSVRSFFLFQLLSRTVGLAMRSYREAGNEIFEGSQSTETFTLAMNDVFDSLNSRLPKEGLTLSSPQMAV